MLPIHIEAMMPQNSCGCSLTTFGPGTMPWMIIAPIIFATVVSGIAHMRDAKKVGRVGGGVVLLDQQPVLPLLARLALHAHEMPAAAELLPVQFEFQMALGIAFVGVTHRRPGAAIPDDDGAAAIFALGDRALEIAIGERVVLHMHGEPLVARHQARAPCHRPAFQDTIHFQAQVVVQARGIVFLDDEAMALGAGAPALGLRRRGKIAFLAIEIERHGQPAFRRGSLAGAFFLVLPLLGMAARASMSCATPSTKASWTATRPSPCCMVKRVSRTTRALPSV